MNNDQQTKHLEKNLNEMGLDLEQVVADLSQKAGMIEWAKNEDAKLLSEFTCFIYDNLGFEVPEYIIEDYLSYVYGGD